MWAVVFTCFWNTHRPSSKNRLVILGIRMHNSMIQFNYLWRHFPVFHHVIFSFLSRGLSWSPLKPNFPLLFIAKFTELLKNRSTIYLKEKGWKVNKWMTPCECDYNLEYNFFLIKWKGTRVNQNKFVDLNWS